MAELVASGRIVDIALATVLVEAALLVLWHRRTGRGLPPGAVLRLLLPGAALMLALRAALTGAGPLWIAAALVAALAAHLADVADRLAGARGPPD